MAHSKCQLCDSGIQHHMFSGVVRVGSCQVVSARALAAQASNPEFNSQ